MSETTGMKPKNDGIHGHGDGIEGGGEGIHGAGSGISTEEGISDDHDFLGGDEVQI